MLIRLARVSITKDSARKKKKGKKREGGGGERERERQRRDTENERLSLEISRDNRCHVFVNTAIRRDNVISTKEGIGESVHLQSESRGRNFIRLAR